MQHILREELQTQIDAFDGIGAAGIVMDVNTSEIVAMVSLPDFDPNRRDRISEDAIFNRATLGVYEMGSTFKIFNTAMALDYGTTTMHNGYDASKLIRIARFTINDDHGKGRWLSVPEIFMYSSNIGSVMMAMDVGGERQKPLWKGSDCSQHLLSSYRAWPPTFSVPMAADQHHDNLFGHGIAVSPVQLANGVSAIVNGGVRHPTTLLRRDKTETPMGERVVPEKTSEFMRRLLRLVVENGTGRNKRQGASRRRKKPERRKSLPGRCLSSQGSLSSSLLHSRSMTHAMSCWAACGRAERQQEFLRIRNRRLGGSARGQAHRRARAAPLLGVAPVDEDAPRNSPPLDGEDPQAKGKAPCVFLSENGDLIRHDPRTAALRLASGALERDVSGLTADSRQVQPGYLFAALSGSRLNGRSFSRRCGPSRCYCGAD